MGALDAAGSHDILKSRPFNEKLVALLRRPIWRLLFDSLDDSALDAWNPAHDHVPERLCQVVHRELERLLGAAVMRRLHHQLVRSPHLDHAFLDLELRILQDRLAYRFSREVQLQILDALPVETHCYEAPLPREDLLDAPRHLSEHGALDAALDDARGRLVAVVRERDLHHRRGNNLGGVDDLLNTGNAERDVHGRDTGEMERLERHLRPRFPDRLRAHRADCAAWLRHRASIPAKALVEKVLELPRGNVNAALLRRSDVEVPGVLEDLALEQELLQVLDESL
mmetsp:Transcript_38256/g.90448  ORF Transcript_38256/g.90448 Transcript_38256/m.90448 type:complete len:283 (+) Transcript_38256:553-1401(+)